MNLIKLKRGFDKFLAEKCSNYMFWSAKVLPRSFENGDKGSSQPTPLGDG
jgi:hypothetical protein